MFYLLMNFVFCIELIIPVLLSGETGIRTLGPAKQDNGFRDRPVRPLRHLSKIFAKVKNIYQIIF